MFWFLVHVSRSANATVTLESGTGIERGRGITARGSGGRERGRERGSGSVRRRGCDGKKSGKGTG